MVSSRSTHAFFQANSTLSYPLRRPFITPCCTWTMALSSSANYAPIPKNHQEKLPAVTEEDFSQDPLCQGYKNIVHLINKASKSFREGKKWTCNNPDHCHHHHNHNHLHHPHCRHYKMLIHSRTVDETKAKNPNRKMLIRQMATTDSDEFTEDDELIQVAEPEQSIRAPRLTVQGRMPSRQWTVDAGVMSSRPSETSAFLLRPISRASVRSGGVDTVFSPNGPAKSPISKAALAAAIAAASKGDSVLVTSADLLGNGRFLSSPSVPNSSDYGRRQKMQKQGTSESAPSPKYIGNPSETAALMLSSETARRPSRMPPRQHSDAGAYGVGTSSRLAPSYLRPSHSHQGITLVRGASCSLVDIPTYLGPSLHAQGGVELAKRCEIVGAICKNVPIPPRQPKPAQTQPENSQEAGQGMARASSHRPRLQLDLTRKNNAAKSGRKAKWTVLCVSLLLLTMCVTLVGTMLSVGSQYQEMVIARHNLDHFYKNKTRQTSDLSKPMSTTDRRVEESSTNNPSSANQPEDFHYLDSSILTKLLQSDGREARSKRQF